MDFLRVFSANKVQIGMKEMYRIHEMRLIPSREANKIDFGLNQR